MTKRSVILTKRGSERANRQVYELTVPNREKMVAIVATDNTRVLGMPRGKIYNSGQIMTAIAEYFLNATRDVMPNFLIESEKAVLPHIMIGAYCEPIPVKFVVRRYLTGSLYEEYVEQNGMTSWGRLGDGLPRYHRFAEPMLTPMYKIDTGEYIPFTEAEIMANGILKPETMKHVREKCFELFMRGESLANMAGLTLADTTFELGWNVHGGMMVIDELLTPNCSRYWELQNEAYSDEHPPVAEKSSEFLSSWVKRKAKKDGVHTDEVIVPARVRREAYYIYAEMHYKLLGLRFNPMKQPSNTEIALRKYLMRNF